MKRAETDKTIVFYLVLFFVSLFLLTSSGDTVYDSDQSLARYETTQAIVEKFDLAIPSGHGLRGIDGRDYCWYGIGQPLLAIPFYIAGRFLGTPQAAVSIMNLFFGAGTAVIIFLFSLSLGYSRKASLLVAIFYGLGTMAWPLSKHPFDHPMETFFILFSVYSLYLYTTDGRLLHLLVSSFAVAIAFTTRYVPLLIVLPLFTQIIIHHIKKLDLRAAMWPIARDMLLFSLTFAPFLCLSLWYNYYRFGSPFETGFSLMANRAGIDVLSGTPLLTGLGGFLMSPGKGLFHYSPVALLFFFSIRSFARKHPATAVCFIVAVLSYLLFYSKTLLWQGDWAWGPRYLLATTPFLVIPAADLFDSDTWSRKKIVRVAVWSLFLVSFAIQLVAVSVFFQKYFVALKHEGKAPFIVVSGDGMMSVAEPSSEIYFHWRRSPILAQFEFFRETVWKIRDVKYSRPQEYRFPSEMKTDRNLMLLDFWWIYEYVLWRKYSGFMVALILLFSTVYAGIRLLKAVQRDSGMCF